jgi:hypothetical protein
MHLWRCIVPLIKMLGKQEMHIEETYKRSIPGIIVKMDCRKCVAVWSCRTIGLNKWVAPFNNQCTPDIMFETGSHIDWQITPDKCRNGSIRAVQLDLLSENAYR